MSCASPGERMRADGGMAKQQNSPADRVGAVCCFVSPTHQGVANGLRSASNMKCSHLSSFNILKEVKLTVN